MRRIWTVFGSVSAFGLLVALGSNFSQKPAAYAQSERGEAKKMNPSESQAVAVIELFTSEGCSSCPPADDNLRRIAKDRTGKKRNVFPLSFHVDYWNQLGWKDPFSQAAFTERQHEYAVALQNDRVYTPQMIVNGTLEFVGSNQRLSDQAIGEALKNPAKHNVKLFASNAGKSQKSSFEYQVKGAQFDDDGYVLNLAIVTDMESVKVARGENGGRALTHVWVVKSLQVIPLESGTGTFQIDPKFIKHEHTQIVGYVQSKTTREITGASALDL